jgi:hypothetical protein
MSLHWDIWLQCSPFFYRSHLWTLLAGWARTNELSNWTGLLSNHFTAVIHYLHRSLWWIFLQNSPFPVYSFSCLRKIFNHATYWGAQFQGNAFQFHLQLYSFKPIIIFVWNACLGTMLVSHRTVLPLTPTSGRYCRCTAPNCTLCQISYRVKRPYNHVLFFCMFCFKVCVSL